MSRTAPDSSDILWGAFRYLADADKAKFQYAWAEALDSLGWLYGAGILALQSARRSLAANVGLTVPLYCFLAAAVATLALVAGMTNRGTTPSWRPPRSFHVTSVVWTLAILAVRYRVAVTCKPTGEVSGGQQHPTESSASKP